MEGCRPFRGPGKAVEGGISQGPTGSRVEFAGSDYLCSPEPVLIPLRLLIPPPAEESVPEPELICDRAVRTDAGFFIGNTHEALSL